MVIKLSKKQFDFLNDYLLQMQIKLRLKLDIKQEIRYTLVEIDVETANEIRDWAGEELQKLGFDTNYELTNEGKILESLIDKFYIE